MEAEGGEAPPQQGGAQRPPPPQDDFIEERLQSLLESDRTDFDAWTSLIAEIERDSPNDVKKICVIYDTFLSEFPLCFGYWQKYASHIARHCTLDEVEKVYGQAVQAAAYSVDLWVSYCSFGILSYEDPADVRRLFARALSFVGKDYLCYLLWDKYIEFEYSQKQWSFLAHVYISTLKFPTKKLDLYYESLKKLIFIWEEEMGCQNGSEMPSEAVDNCETNGEVCEFTDISNVIRDLLAGRNAVKKFLSVVEDLYHRSSQLDGKISLFEAGIRRPYFHVQSLDDCQLKNWHQYLDFVEMQGDFDWTVKLYERCLIACANYSEFWIRYVEFVKAKGGKEIANDALGRALTVFLKKVPAFHLYCAMFKEQVGDATGARDSFLRASTDLTPDFILNVKREANMEKRLGNTEAAFMIYEKSIAMAKLKRNPHAYSILYDNYALFTLKVTESSDAAVDVFIKGVQQMPCKSILERFMHFVTMHGGAGQISKVDAVIADAISPNAEISQALSCNDHEDISELFLEFVDLHGTINEIRDAWDRHRRLFPRIMAPNTACYNTTSGDHTTDKIMEARRGTLVVSLHHVNGGSKHDDAHVQLTNSRSIPNDTTALLKDVVVCNLRTETNDKNIQMEEEAHLEASEVQKEAIVEKVDLLVEVDESIHENHDISQNSVGSLKNPRIEDLEHGHHERELGDGIRPPSCDNISINFPDNGAQKSNLFSHDHDGAQEATSRSPRDEVQDAHESSEASTVHMSNKTQMRPNTPSKANLERDNSPLCLHTTPIPSEVGRGQEFQKEAQLQSNSRQQLPVDSYRKTGSGGNLAQMNYGGRAPETSSMEIQGYTQDSQPQQWHVQAHLQYPPTSTYAQLVMAPDYQYQPQALNKMEDQQASQSQSQYMVTSGQAYPTSVSASSGQNVQQGFVYAQTLLSTQPASQPQTQVYQQTQMSSEQYGYMQSSQGYLSNIWQYYQQQHYYLQQQQLQIQQQMHQLQQQQQLNQKDQQQYSSQHQQVQPQQQQKNLLYLQQQQHLILQQQQQLVLFQQQQQQLLQQWQQQHQNQQQQQQYQQLIQQHQQLFQQQQQQQQQLLQQQQQLLQRQQQLAQQQQQQQQMTALDLQGEGAKIQKPEQSMRSSHSELHVSPNK